MSRLNPANGRLAFHGNELISSLAQDRTCWLGSVVDRPIVQLTTVWKAGLRDIETFAIAFVEVAFRKPEVSVADC